MYTINAEKTSLGNNAAEIMAKCPVCGFNVTVWTENGSSYNCNHYDGHVWSNNNGFIYFKEK